MQMSATKIPTEQNYGDDPLEVRDTDQYQEEYVSSFVDKWDELIDWEGRSQSEGEFFIEILRNHGAKKVLDVSTGTGYHSVQLLKAGFEVTSVDGSPMMLAKAFENGRREGFILRTIKADWRYLNQDVHDLYDAVICLGNSFTHLHNENDRRKALAEYYATLRHDGILILDQRNYDALLTGKSKPSHKYYYCGEDVTAEPEHIDESLARFKYTFSDGSEFHLNMFPLQKEYVRRLMKEVGFQRVTTYGDFQETYKESEPDFFIHVAEKKYKKYTDVVETAREYYNSDDADNFYYHIWGGNDIHIGLYEDGDTIAEASHRTVEKMAEQLPPLDKYSRVLDIGAGYGGAARHLAKEFGCRVTALNLSEAENQRNRKMNREAGLDKLIDVVDGDFEQIPEDRASYDVVWSQDAILHSGDRAKVIKEVARVLKPGGHFILTDPMQADNCPEGVLQPVLDRIHLDSLGSPAFYKREAGKNGMEFVEFIDYTPQLGNHYQRVRDELTKHEQELEGKVSEDYIERMKKGLMHWVNANKNGYLVWGILHFVKK
ncbi:MAG: methyltransferase domain-containing protein [Gammaproteobacteria bacterium]